MFHCTLQSVWLRNTLICHTIWHTFCHTIGEYMPKNYMQRNGWFYYNRRVPKAIKAIDPRKHIRIALKTKLEQEAQRLASNYDYYLDQHWDSLLSSDLQLSPNVFRYVNHSITVCYSLPLISYLQCNINTNLECKHVKLLLVSAKT